MIKNLGELTTPKPQKPPGLGSLSSPIVPNVITIEAPTHKNPPPLSNPNSREFALHLIRKLTTHNREEFPPLLTRKLINENALASLPTRKLTREEE